MLELWIIVEIYDDFQEVATDFAKLPEARQGIMQVAQDEEWATHDNGVAVGEGERDGDEWVEGRSLWQQTYGAFG